jgi:hypothetical protein
MLARRALPTLIAASLLAAACGASGARRAAGRAGPQPASVALPEISPSPRQNVPPALDNPTGAGLPKPLIDPAQFLDGGPPPDGIPAIDHPRFLRADQVGFLTEKEPVVAVQVGGEDRAYPIQILIWHEIVNDTVGGVPVAVTYCPLCNTAVAYDRRVDNKVLDFGVSGKLYDSDQVMYDRQTRSLWVQFLGQAVAGVATGTQLTAHPAQTVAWGDWRRAHPIAWVLSRDTGFSRDYGSNPYPGYDDPVTSPFLFNKPSDARLPAKTRVVGLRQGNDAVAVTDDALRRAPVMTITLAGQTVVVWLKPGTTSPLDTPSSTTGKDIGATGAFLPTIAGRLLHFHPTADGFQDRETGTIWDVLGHATSGPLAGQALTPVTHVDTFWFAWAAFLPSTRLISS